MKKIEKKEIAVLIPAYNEELTIEKVVNDFKAELPEAEIYVYNNNSKDNTAELAKKAGAIVVDEYQQGKGNVVRSMFQDIDADAYVMVDADDTYPADEVHKLLEPVLNGKADMVIGDRLSSTYYTENKRPFHNFGNNLVRNLVNFLFKSHIHDIMTGYRVFSKKFVKCMPVMSDGFQIETEMTVFSLVYHMNIVEIPVQYRDRPEGSFSKLNTYKDGARVLIKLFDLLKDNRPFMFFGIIGLLLLIISLIIYIPISAGYGLIYALMYFPSRSVWAVVLFTWSVVMFMIGIIMDAIKNTKQYEFMAHIDQVVESLKRK